MERSFLATAKAEIKLAMGALELCINDEKIRFCIIDEAWTLGGSLSQLMEEAKQIEEIEETVELKSECGEEVEKGSACVRPPWCD